MDVSVTVTPGVTVGGGLMVNTGCGLNVVLSDRSIYMAETAFKPTPVKVIS